jgi:hypothetical protein
MNGSAGIGSRKDAQAERSTKQRGGVKGKTRTAAQQSRVNETSTSKVFENNLEEFVEVVEEDFEDWDASRTGLEMETSRVLWMIGEAPAVKEGVDPEPMPPGNVFHFEVYDVDTAAPFIKVRLHYSERDSEWIRRLRTGGLQGHIAEMIKQKLNDQVEIATYIARKQEPYLIYLELARCQPDKVKGIKMPGLLINPLKQRDMVHETLEGRTYKTWNSAVSRHLNQMLLVLPGSKGVPITPRIFLEGNKGNSMGIKDDVLIPVLLEVLEGEEYGQRKKARGEDSALYVMEALARKIKGSLKQYYEELYPGSLAQTTQEQDFDKAGRVSKIEIEIHSNDNERRVIINKLIAAAKAFIQGGG